MNKKENHDRSSLTSCLPAKRKTIKQQILSLAVVTYFILLTIFICLAFFSKGTFQELTREDGIMEYAQAVFYFILAFIFLYLLKKRLSSECPRIGWLFCLGFFLLFLLVACEEISWGQRILGFDTPSDMQDDNFQDEINLHNRGNYFEGVFFFSYSISIVLFILVLTILIPALRVRSSRVRDYIERNRITLPQPELIFGFVIGACFGFVPNHRNLFIMVLVVAVVIMVPFVIFLGPTIIRFLRTSRLFRFQVLTIALAASGVLAVNVFASPDTQSMFEFREFFIGLSFLFFGILSFLEERELENSASVKVIAS